MIATILIGSTAFTVVACVVCATLLRLKPAQRYAFLCASFSGLLLLPVAALVAGRLGLSSVRLPVYAQKAATPIEALPSVQPAASTPQQVTAPAIVRQPAQYAPVAAPSQFHPHHGKFSSRPRRFSLSPTALAVGATSVIGSRLDKPINWPIWALTGLYLAGFLFVLARFISSALRLSRAASKATVAEGTPLGVLADSLRERIGLRRFPATLISDEIEAPLALGWRKPAILIPTIIAYSASEEELESILLHEFAHIDQRHVLSIWPTAVAKALYWFNPFVHRAAFELCRAREEVCDSYVIKLVPATRLARTLLKVAQMRGRVSPQVAAPAFLFPEWNLEKRVAGLLDPARNCETQVTRFKMTTFNLSAAALCATFAGIQLVQAQEVVRVKQNGHTYVLHASKKHPITVEVQSGHGLSKLVVGPKGVTVASGMFALSAPNVMVSGIRGTHGFTVSPTAPSITFVSPVAPPAPPAIAPVPSGSFQVAPPRPPVAITSAQGGLTFIAPSQAPVANPATPPSAGIGGGSATPAQPAPAGGMGGGGGFAGGGGLGGTVQGRPGIGGGGLGGGIAAPSPGIGGGGLGVPRAPQGMGGGGGIAAPSQGLSGGGLGAPRAPQGMGGGGITAPFQGVGGLSLQTMRALGAEGSIVVHLPASQRPPQASTATPTAPPSAPEIPSRPSIRILIGHSRTFTVYDSTMKPFYFNINSHQDQYPTKALTLSLPGKSVLIRPGNKLKSGSTTYSIEDPRIEKGGLFIHVSRKRPLRFTISTLDGKAMEVELTPPDDDDHLFTIKQLPPDEPKAKPATTPAKP